jgi:hypothetical protein
MGIARAHVLAEDTEKGVEEFEKAQKLFSEVYGEDSQYV